MHSQTVIDWLYLPVEKIKPGYHWFFFFGGWGVSGFLMSVVMMDNCIFPLFWEDDDSSTYKHYTKEKQNHKLYNDYRLFPKKIVFFSLNCLITSLKQSYTSSELYCYWNLRVRLCLTFEAKISVFKRG